MLFRREGRLRPLLGLATPGDLGFTSGAAALRGPLATALLVAAGCRLCGSQQGVEEPHCEGQTGMPSTAARAASLGFTQKNVEEFAAAASRRSKVDGHALDELFVQESCFPSEACEELVEVAAHLMVPGHACSIDGEPEYQVDLLQKPRHQERSDPKYTEYVSDMFRTAFPHIRECLIPTISTVYKARAEDLRFAEAFIRKYQDVRAHSAQHSAHRQPR